MASVYKLHVSLCVYILGLIIITYGSPESFCTNQDPCTCNTAHGLIDLRSVGRSDRTARFFISSSGIQGDDLIAIEDHQPSYYYNPCYPFDVGPPSQTDEGCKDVAVCQYNSNEPQFVDMGDQHQVVFGYSTDRGMLYINYTTKSNGGGGGGGLVCDKRTDNTLEWNGLVDDAPTFNLLSPCACYDGCVRTVSPGTILCVVFVCLVSTYLVVGVLYRKAVHGATGVQLLPNLSFWTSLPGLIKDGYLFFVSPCWTSSVQYEQL
ncbi:uncharacterized protein [Argopecten irradians]|uniref:uncharacterized protein n=1 Tax=Argopecten irradians TaxID=31199 RepID=UPI0037234B9C